MTDIVEAAAEIERLTADREKWKASWLEMQTRVNELGAEIVTIHVQKEADIRRIAIECGKANDDNARLRAALEGLLMEWDKLTRYGSPMAKAANERVTAARAALLGKEG